MQNPVKPEGARASEHSECSKQEKSSADVREHLRQGGVVAYRTDTFYGLGADPFNESAVANIFRIKKRLADKPILVLISHEGQLEQLVEEVGPEARTLIDRLWPGPLTLLLKVRAGLPEALTAGTGKIGVRLPADPVCVKFLNAIESPLTATSANLSGAPGCQTAEEVRSAFGADLMIVNGGKSRGEKESTVVDAAVSPPILIRKGAVEKSKIESVLGMQIRSRS